MVGVGNPLGLRFSVALSDNAIERSKLMKTALTGQKQEISAVNYTLGTKARYAAAGYGAILKRVGYGVSLTNVAIATLTNIQDQIEEMKTSLVSLNNADQRTLQIAEKNYQDQWSRIFATLENTEFAGKKLFDGTFAKVPQVRIAAHNLPEHAHPLEIQLDDPNSNHKLSIPIPRLLPGDGTIDNPSVENTYTPICQIRSNVQEILDAVRNIPVTNINHTSDRNSWRWDAGEWCWKEEALDGSFGTQLRLIDEALPEGVSAELDFARRFCRHWFVRTAEGTTYGARREETAALARQYLNYAKSLVPVSFIPNIADTITREVEEITTRIQNINADVGKLEQSLRELPEREGSSYTFGVLKNIVVNNFPMFRLIMGGVPAIKQSLINKLNDLRDYLTNNRLRLDQSFLIGSVLTASSRNKASQILDHANDTLTKVIADLKTKQRELTLTATNLQTLSITLNEASNNYLNENYEVIVPKLIELLRADSMLSLAFYLSEKAIDAVISQMENIASL